LSLRDSYFDHQTKSKALNMETSHFSTLVKDYIRYNYWANKTLIDFLRTKPAEQLEAIIPSSFPSIRHTIDHIMQTERFWLSVLTKKPIVTERTIFQGNLDELVDTFLETSEELLTYGENLSEDELVEEVIFTSPWVNSVSPRYQFIQHALNHSTYHRGQIITIGRNLGFSDAPMTDYNFFLVMRSASEKAIAS
jgi:uncharacterized damage-inducible protein DinB